MWFSLGFFSVLVLDSSVLHILLKVYLMCYLQSSDSEDKPHTFWNRYLCNISINILWKTFFTIWSYICERFFFPLHLILWKLGINWIFTLGSCIIDSTVKLGSCAIFILSELWRRCSYLCSGGFITSIVIFIRIWWNLSFLECVSGVQCFS